LILQINTYENRIRPLLLGVADNDAQVIGFLKSHLSGDLFTWMRIANPAGINAFFTGLKNMWLEHTPNSFGRQISDQISNLPQSNLITSNIVPLQTIQNIPSKSQSNDAHVYLESIADYFGYPDNNPKNSKDLFNFIETEFGKRVGQVHYARKRTFVPKIKKVYKTTKKSSSKHTKSSRHCSNCGKTGHTKKTCTNKKKSSKKVNFVETSENEESDSESSSSETLCHSANNLSSEEETDSDTDSSEKESYSSFGAKKKR